MTILKDMQDSLPTIIPRSDHNISRVNISKYALKVLYRLKEAGFGAYLVGGGVRDMLLGREPKDFDVATDAHPEQLKELFKNCRLIGRRFRLAHVHFGNEIIEVATFRARSNGNVEAGEEVGELKDESGRILRDNIYGTLEEDAWRRDFTVNALYYDIRDFSVVDYTGGIPDLKAGMIRLIGDPEQRYREDPVRMLRAVRFAAKLGFRIHPATEAPLFTHGALLKDVPSARLFEEVLKLFMGGSALESFELLRHYGLFAYLFPSAEAALAQEQNHFPLTLVAQALRNTDARIAEDKPVTPAFLYAALLWYPMIQQAQQMMAAGISELMAMQEAANEVVNAQTKVTVLPKRFSVPMREIWFLQPRFSRRTGVRPLRLVAHPRFRAAYDFLLLRNEAGEPWQELCDWWTEFQTLDAQERASRVNSKRGGKRGGKKTKTKPAPQEH